MPPARRPAPPPPARSRPAAAPPPHPAPPPPPRQAEAPRAATLPPKPPLREPAPKPAPRVQPKPAPREPPSSAHRPAPTAARETPTLRARSATAPGHAATRPGVKPRPGAHPTFESIPAPHKGTIRARPGTGRPGGGGVRKPQKPKVKKGKRAPGADGHGPAAGYQQAQEDAAYTSEQTDNIITCLTACHQEGADALATEALMCLGYGENSWNTDGCNNSDHCGVFQLDSSWQAMHDYRDVGYWAVYALRQGFYGKGGIIQIARDHPDWPPGWVTNWCQGAYDTPGGGNDYYDQFRADARWAIETYGKRAGLKLTAAQLGAGAGGGGGGGLPPLSTGNPSALIRSTDWAGNVENAYKFVRGGANESANISGKTKDRVVKLAVIGWTGEKKQ